MDGRVETKPAFILRRIVDLAVGDEQRTRHAVRRDIRHRLAERREQVGRLPAGVLAAGHMHKAGFEIGDFCELVLQLRLDLARAIRPARQLHAGACVDGDNRDIGQRLPVLALEVGVCERGEKAGEAQSPQHDAAPAAPCEQDNRRKAKQRQGREQLAREEGEELNGPVHESLKTPSPRPSPQGERDVPYPG